MNLPTRNVLMICYAFPPVGGAGVQRSVKFVKYLKKYGWHPTVFTVENPSVPVLDENLNNDIPQDTRILRSRTWEPSYRTKRNWISSNTIKPSRLKSFVRGLASQWLQPDPQILWNFNAFQLAKKRLERGHIDAIYVSGPPFSSFLLGCRLKAHFRVPLVLDFRDEWSLSARYLENQSRAGRALQRQMKMFETTLRDADAIVATTQASARELQNCLERIGRHIPVQCIYNGYDPDDLTPLNRHANISSTFRLVYTGTLWRLTDISPLVSAMQSLARNRPGLTGHMELHIVGRRTPDQDLALEPLKNTTIQLRLHEYLPHHESLQMALDADALLLLLSDKPGAERVVPGKLFEYLALKRPILSIVPDGETRDLLSKAHGASTFHGLQTASIANWLANAIESKQAFNATDSVRDLSSFDTDLDWCNRSTLTLQLSNLLDEVTGKSKNQ